MGQTRKDCALHPSCQRNCENRDENVKCAQACVTNGCECKNGTVLDEAVNKCIAPSECPGMYIIN